jgi:cytochrome P450
LNLDIQKKKGVELSASDPPGPGRLAALRPLLAMCHDRITPVVEMLDRYGSIAMLEGVKGRIYLVNEPQAVSALLVGAHRDVMKDTGHQLFLRPVLGNGLLLSEGEAHLRQRRMMQPAFHSDRIADYARTMVRFARRTVGAWENGQRIDAMHEMMSLALDVVGKTLFNSEIAEDKRGISGAIEAIMNADSLLLHPFAPLLMRLPLHRVRRFRAALKELDVIVYRIIAEHHESGGGGDLLDMLMAARDEETGEPMSDKALRDEVLTLFLAGHETTANTMAWAWRLISEHPDVEHRFHEEVDSVLSGCPPTMEDFARLPYTRMIVNETLRLYPPAYFFGRETLRPIEILGYTIPPHSQVLLSPFVSHRDPRFFAEPERFDPERFAPDRDAERPRDAYFPFGAGPRKCIGERFALMEVVLVLATIGQRWRLTAGGASRPAIDPRITLRPKDGMPMVVQTRDGADNG